MEETSEQGSQTHVGGKRKFKSDPSGNHGEEEMSDGKSPPWRKNQRMNLVNKDRISGLGDDVLLHVLSYLNTVEAIRTCVLSKRWTDLWTCVPSLSFDVKSTACKSVDQFISLVKNTLILYRSSKVIKFLLKFPHGWLQGDVCIDFKLLDSWILFAISADVEELSLDLCKDYSLPFCTKEYKIPRDIFACSSLTKLHLSNCDIVPRGVFTWALLKSLSIEYGNLPDRVMLKLLAGSPALEVLELCDCFGLNRLDITSASMRKLVLKDFRGSSGRLKIFAPNIHALEILGNFETTCRLVDVSSLVSAHIDLELKDKFMKTKLSRRVKMFKFMDFSDTYHKDKYYTGRKKMLNELLSGLLHVKELKLGIRSLQLVTTLLERKSLRSPLSGCKSLTLKALIKERELQGVASLLGKLPHLETLIIDPSTCRCGEAFLPAYEDERMMSFASEEKILSSMQLDDLKMVKIVGSHLCNEKQITSLAEFLLKNAKALEMLVFKESLHTSGYGKGVVLKIAHKLLSFPRSSPQAMISFSL